MKERFGAKKSTSQMLRFHTQTAGNSLTAQQIDNNIVRVTIQALSAVLGGTQSLHTNSRDEALTLPTEDSVRIALRTQQIIAHESGITNTIDPFAGSYYIEELTKQIEEQAQALMNKIDELGGVITCIEEGFIQQEIETASYEYQKEVESGDRIIVGMNAFQVDENVKIPLLRIDPIVEQEQVERLIRLKKERHNDDVRSSLNRLRDAAQKADNLMPPILDAVKAYATLGEICNIFREVFGEYRDRG
jgi:methylmalonyl-CoA mutase N-terminal domain/subunit